MSIAVLMFVVSQIDLHMTLTAHKVLVGKRLIRGRMLTNAQLIKEASTLRPDPSGKPKTDKEVKRLDSLISLQETTLDTIDSMTGRFKTTSTWSFDMSSVSRISIPVLFEVVLKC